MKRILYILLPVFLLSCENMLDEVPKDFVSRANYYQSEADAQEQCHHPSSLPNRPAGRSSSTSAMAAMVPMMMKMSMKSGHTVSGITVSQRS